MRVLVTGGAGYIGSHVIKALLSAGHEPAAYDNLSRGHEAAVSQAVLITGDTRDRPRLADVLRVFRPEAVVHLAALTVGPESISSPTLYYDNNVVGAVTLLDEMLKSGVNRLIFSSSAAVYGTPRSAPITERHAPRPSTPYGETKLCVERLLDAVTRSHGLRAVSLRYFNAAGADPEGTLGEDHDPETHVLPLILRAQTTGDELVVCGDDYPTPDGTCIRDYVHVSDLARAHVQALDHLVAEDVPGHHVYNLGSGRGFSVREVVQAVAAVTGRPVRYRIGPRRPGDPAILVASVGKAARELGWRPRLSDLETIVTTAWTWHQSQPRGRGDRDDEARAQVSS